MSDALDKEVLNIINDNLDALDCEGVWAFLQKILTKGLNWDCTRCATLSIFMMRLFDDDIESLIDILVEEGWHKWSHLDKWNSYMSKSYIDIEDLYRKCEYFFGGLPGKDYSQRLNPEVITIDFATYESKVDFTCCNQKDPRSTVPLNHPINKSVIKGYAILGNVREYLRDDLYVAVECCEENNLKGKGSAAHEFHYLYPYYNLYQLRGSGDIEIIYIPISKFIEEFEDKRGLIYSSGATTILPKEILEQYNMPIWEG